MREDPYCIAHLEQYAEMKMRRGVTLSTAMAVVCGMLATESLQAQGVPCIAGFAGPYACSNVDLLAIVPSGEIVAGSGNPSSGSDMWGWTDAETGREYALQGLSDSVAFIDVTDPVNPIFVGHLPAPATNFLWRDLKVFGNHVYIVGDFSPTLPGSSSPAIHGLQIFDLTRLREAGPLEVFVEDAVYTGFDEAHNIAINEETGIAYVVASDTCGNEFHILDLNQDPEDPVFLGCFDSGLPGAVHDAQCLIYGGPDTEHQGKEICLAFMEDQFSIVDMSDKSGPVTNLTGPKVLATKVYEGLGYVHQGWFDPSHTFVASNDELDELNAFVDGSPHNTHAYIWDATDLEDPIHIGTYVGPTGSIDHNHYFNGRFLHQTNYTAGYRVLDAVDIADAELTEVAFFDTFPPNADPAPAFAGLWSGYFFFASGVVAVSQIDGGELFVLRPHLPDDDGDGEAVGKATGGGWLADDAGGKINFGFQVEDEAAGPEGSLQLNDKGAGVKIRLEEVNLVRSVEGECGSIVASEQALEFRGSGTFNKEQAASFRVCVEDNGAGSNGTPDRLHLECIAGCAYTTGDRTPDDALDGGNIQVQRGDPESGDADSMSADIATLILEPVLLSKAEVGALELLSVRAFGGDQEPLSGVEVSLQRISADGSQGTLTAVTDGVGTVVFSVTIPSQPSEYRAVADAAESNTLEITPILP